MAQIIDIEERRRPRRSLPERPPSPPSAFDPGGYLDSAAGLWRSWLATWGSLWLSPFGLQVSPLETRPPDEARDRAKPRS